MSVLQMHCFVVYVCISDRTELFLCFLCFPDNVTKCCVTDGDMSLMMCFLLQAVAAEFQNESAAALAAAATRHLQEAEQAKNGGNEHWYETLNTGKHCSLYTSAPQIWCSCFKQT